MMISVPDLLDTDIVARVRQIIDAAPWINGNATSGPQAALAKNNEQLAEGSPAAREAGTIILNALGNSPLFFAAALPRKILPPRFNRYTGGGTYGFHVDGSVMDLGNGEWLRSDVSCTLFLADPDSYDGGELVVSDTYGEHEVKLPAGDMVVYPSSSLHRVTPVTRGARIASFFWVQSLVRDGERRRLLLELDTSIQSLTTSGADRESVLRLTNIYHNLLRRWAEV